MKTPPLLPEETLHRVLRVANFNGLSVLAVAGMLTLAVASTGNYVGAAIGLLVAAAGAFELHGAGLLRAGEPKGLRWLIGSQPYLFAVMLVYCGLRLVSFDPTLLRAAMTDEMRVVLEQQGYPEEDFLRLVYVATYAILALATLIYQGAMAAYYLNRREAVLAALDVDEEHDRFN